MLYPPGSAASGATTPRLHRRTAPSRTSGWWEFATRRVKIAAGPSGASRKAVPFSGLPDRLPEQLQNAPVLVRPAVGPPEAVRLDRIHGHVPALLAQLDQPLDEARGVLEVHVVVHHAVADEEPALQPFREIDGRGLFVRDAIRLRLVEDARGVGMVVVDPIGHGAKRRAGGEDAGPREHRHQRDEPTVAAAVDPDARR